MNDLFLQKKAFGEKELICYWEKMLTHFILFRKPLHNLFPRHFKKSTYFDSVIPFLGVLPEKKTTIQIFRQRFMHKDVSFISTEKNELSKQ